MTKSAENLKAVLEYYGIAQRELSLALGIDPSLVSRWLTGARKLRAASQQIEEIADFILTRSRRVKDMEWLKEQFQTAGLPTELSTVYRLKQNLILWLADDGENLRRNLGGSPAGAAKAPATKKARAAEHAEGGDTIVGLLDIALALKPILNELPPNSEADLFLSTDQIASAASEDIAALLMHTMEKTGLKIRLVVCVSGNTRAMSTLINTYMVALISGHIQLSVVHGMTQTVTNQMHLIIPGVAVMLVTETPGTVAPPMAVIIRESVFLSEVMQSFEQTARYAHPVLDVYGDDYSRNILEILYREFCTPGSLDVVKDNLNPMYMTEAAYDRMLLRQGHRDAEYAWRSAEFVRFKSGLNETLKGGSVFREILPLPRLNQSVQDGYCRMPGLYFMTKGFVQLDARGCLDILNGYISYLETVPNFHLLILDDISVLQKDACWQLKQNHHLAINHWSGPGPVMIYSDQLILLREFQTNFDALWARGLGGIGSRAGVIAVLRDVAERLTKRHLLPTSETNGTV
ncbi:MAG: helix-turn-helix domain-containing protein [Oscillospiraceae bacterium]